MKRQAGKACEPQARRDLQREAQPAVLDVIHPDVAHADPGVDQDARDEKKGRKAHPPLREQRLPRGIRHRPASQSEQERDRIDEHHHGGDALGEPARQSVVRADDDACHHSFAPMKTVSARLTTKTATALLRPALTSTPMSLARNSCRTPPPTFTRYSPT